MLNYPSQKQAMLSVLKPGEKFLFAVVMLFILGLIFQFLGAFLAALLYGFRVSEILSIGDFSDPKYVAASKLIQIIGAVHFSFLLDFFLFCFSFFISLQRRSFFILPF